MEKEYVILVDSQDNPIGSMEKLEAHQKGLLHRAFSVFLFNENNELLLQQRASEKYHSPNLWTNTCCSHPREEETILSAGSRRLKEEMGISCAIEPLFSFVYKADFDNGLIEHEFDHVLVGRYSRQPQMNPEEVQNFQYISLDLLQERVKQNPQNYTPWLSIILEKHINKFAAWLK